MKLHGYAKLDFVTIVLFSIGLSGCGKDGGDAKSEVPVGGEVTADAKPKILLEHGRLTVDGKQAPLPGAVADWEVLLGPTTRREALAANEKEPAVNVYIWDKLGVVAVERPDLAQITKVTLAIERPLKSSGSDGAATHLPSEAFPGLLAIDGARVSSATTPQKLNAELGNLQFAQLKKFPHSWNLAYGAWTITALTDVKGERLVEIAIGE